MADVSGSVLQLSPSRNNSNDDEFIYINRSSCSIGCVATFQHTCSNRSQWKREISRKLLLSSNWSRAEHQPIWMREKRGNILLIQTVCAIKRHVQKATGGAWQTKTQVDGSQFVAFVFLGRWHWIATELLVYRIELSTERHFYHRMLLTKLKWKLKFRVDVMLNRVPVQIAVETR